MCFNWSTSDDVSNMIDGRIYSFVKEIKSIHTRLVYHLLFVNSKYNTLKVKYVLRAFIP